MKINQDGTEIYSIDPFGEISNDSPKTFHNEFNVLTVGIVATNSVM